VRRLLTRRWVLAHVLLVLAVAAFVALGRWQFDRAQSGRGTAASLAYSLEWWLFAGCAIWFWAREARAAVRAARQGTDAGTPGAVTLVSAPDGMANALPPGLRGRTAPPPVEDEDPELAAYNRYLAELHARAQRSGR